MATGGAAALWRRTTNPRGAIGAGPVMAATAGADLADLEFCQFHPTALALPGTRFDGVLITEAVRGEGATLLDASGRRFTDELAPRDAVTAAILDRIEADGVDSVRLDLRDLDPARFPNVFKSLAEAGLSPGTEPVPVSPAAHYTMGGIATDLDGRSSLPGLFAVGECSCTGLHGANRLASNSLSECFVFGGRAGRGATGEVFRERARRSPIGASRPRRRRQGTPSGASPGRCGARSCCGSCSTTPIRSPSRSRRPRSSARSPGAATCGPTSRASTPRSTASTSWSGRTARPGARHGAEFLGPPFWLA